MAQQNIDFGTFPDDPSADAIRTAFSKVQNNFNQLFGTNANSTVTSINRTPGAGVTVNYPTGNVIISANIACLQVSTTSLKVGRGADNTQSNVTITSSSQQLNIDIDPANVFSANFGAPGLGLANFNGTLTSNSFYQPNINALGTLSSLDVSGNANFTGNSSFTNNATFSGTTINFSGASNVNLGSISNIHISGGTVGYYLQTDGLGNLIWGTVGSFELRSTRRNATVTISAPDTASASRVCSFEAYLPVPTMIRDDNVLSPSFQVSITNLLRRT